AHNEHARLEVAALGKHHMTDALHVVEMGNALRRDPFSCEGKNGRALSIEGGYIVVRHDHDPVGVPNLDAKALQYRFHPSRAAGIMHHGEIVLAGDDLAGPD